MRAAVAVAVCMTEPGRAGAEVLAVGWLRQGLGLAAGCRCGVRSVAGAGRCRWAWLHRHGQLNPAGITPQSRGHRWAAAAAAEPLPCKLSARLITIYELSDGGSTCPASVTPSAAALLVAVVCPAGGQAYPVELVAVAALVLALHPLRPRPLPIAAATRPVAAGPAPCRSCWGGPKAPPAGGQQLASRRGPHQITRPKTDHAALALGWPETVCVVAMASPGSAQERRRLMLERFRVGGWLPRAHIDGWDSSGQRTCWEEWEHLDGRRAIENADGRCTDPELEELLRARRGAGTKRRGWRVLAAAVRVLRWWLRVLNR